MRIVFMGTPEFAVSSLEMLINEGYEIVAVVTQPDRQKGRGNKLSAPPVKELALKHSIDVLQPDKIKTPEFVETIRALKPDLLITAAYGRILSKELLEVPVYGCINVHGSLLPAYRGAAPINWAVINGEKTTGITTMYTDVGIDNGDMLLKREMPIAPDITADELQEKMAVLGAEVLRDTLIELKNGTLIRTPQDDSMSSYAPIISKELGLIDWDKTALQIYNLVRGTYPWPGAYTFLNGNRMRIWRTCVISNLEIIPDSQSKVLSNEAALESNIVINIKPNTQPNTIINIISNEEQNIETNSELNTESGVVININSCAEKNITINIKPNSEISIIQKAEAIADTKAEAEMGLEINPELSEGVDKELKPIAGEIIKVDNDGILVKCSDEYILIKELQFDSSKRMSVADYIRGHKINVGDKLGK